MSYLHSLKVVVEYLTNQSVTPVDAPDSVVECAIDLNSVIVAIEGAQKTDTVKVLAKALLMEILGDGVPLEPGDKVLLKGGSKPVMMTVGTVTPKSVGFSFIDAAKKAAKK